MPYLTVEEMRRNPKMVEEVDESGGTRFIGSTEPSLALKYFPRDGTILECGPHFGKFTQFLQEHGYTKVHALDFFDVLHFPDRKRLIFGIIDFNKEKMPYPDDFFDGVTAWGIGEHMENPFHFMREVHRTLKDGRVFIYALPNVLHLMSRLIFLRRGLLPRWNYKNNHIAVIPPGVFDKTFLRYFNLVQTLYIRPQFKYLFFDRFARCLPANKWFGSFVIYILRKKQFIPYA